MISKTDILLVIKQIWRMIDCFFFVLFCFVNKNYKSVMYCFIFVKLSIQSLKSGIGSCIALKLDLHAIQLKGQFIGGISSLRW